MHQLACLIGYGAAAVHPWLALRAASALSGTRGYEETSESELQRNYVKMLEYGMLKVCFEDGHLDRYWLPRRTNFRGDWAVEALVDAYFTGTPSRLGGIGLAEIETRSGHASSRSLRAPDAKLPDPGFVRFRKDGEAHAY